MNYFITTELLGRWLLLVLVQRLHVYSRSSSIAHKYTHAQTITKYKKTVQNYIEIAQKTSLKLFYALQRSRGYKEHLKRS
jgi:predicted component of type VI protein secretion system